MATGDQEMSNILILISFVILGISAFVCGTIVGKVGRKTLLDYGCILCEILIVIVRISMQ